MEPSRSPVSAVAIPVVVVPDDVVGDGPVGELLAVVELVRLAAPAAVQHEVARAVPRPEINNHRSIIIKVGDGKQS